jgi:hypothetical protein
MTTRLVSLTFDATDPVRLARFWASALGWEIADERGDEIGVLPTDGTRFILVFVRVPEAKTAKNPIHVEVVTESVDDQRAVVGRLLELGATHVDIGQGPESDLGTVLGDPEGNELCVGVRGEFLADTGVLGAITFEPAHLETGYFWGQAIGWPVVYDEGGDTAIRDPSGTGPFITFGPPGTAKHAKGRLHLDLAPQVGDDHAAEVERLLALGARRIDIGQGDVPWVVLADPDGNEFCLLTPR